jgi:L,D-transpeptidase ErfK/SrfK
VAALFAQVEVGTPVEIVYEPLLVTVEDGRVWIEAHPDPYGRLRHPKAELERRAAALGVPVEALDPAAIAEVLKHRDGFAREVGEWRGAPAGDVTAVAAP